MESAAFANLSTSISQVAEQYNSRRHYCVWNVMEHESKYLKPEKAQSPIEHVYVAECRFALILNCFIIV